jgi:HD-GYP domain-containing protein (c-di-GMP phosphodiesterase class II)
MTTHRPYQAAMNPDYVLEIMGRLAGKRYDAAVVAALTTLVRGGVLNVRNVRTPVSFQVRRPVPEMA